MEALMGNLRPWFSEDIAALIKSILFATRETESQEYKRGFLACAIAICMAIGIEINDVR
jgi:hypothetical protein